MRAGNERAREVIGEARGQVDTILDTARGIGKPTVRDEIVRLCKTADQILAELSAEPRKVAAARSFLTYYLDAAQRIVESYADLMKRGVAGGDAAQTLARAEQSLATVQQAFDRELEAVLQDQVLDLEAEIELLERTVATAHLFKTAPTAAADGERG